MNIRDLRYLVALGDYRHFGKAAEACFVSQPALSMQIKKLEESLGVTLVERTHKSVLLTEVGVAIVRRASSILQQVGEIRDLAALANDPESGEFTMGIIPTLAPYLLPLIVPPLSKEFPKISFYLLEEQHALLIEKLSLGKLDAILLAHTVTETNMVSSSLFEEEFLLAVPNKHPLAKQKAVNQKELASENFLLLDEGHCMRDQALALCHKAQASEMQGFRATSLETLRYMVAAGVGMTLLPALAQKSNDGISYIPFISPKPARRVDIFWRRSSSKQALVEHMVSAIRKIMLKHKAVKVLQ